VADAQATQIYASAYNQSPEAVQFYEFTRTMQAYRSVVAANATLILSTDSELFKFLKGMAPDGDASASRRGASVDDDDMRGLSRRLHDVPGAAISAHPAGSSGDVR
jgi:hypothetical protein